jgi:cell wall-associated protease
MKSALGLMLGLVTSVNAATIAVIDSGLDYRHEMIRSNLWINSAPMKTGSYPNAIYGWNFAEKNNQVIDLSMIGTFHADVKKFYELQNKSYLFSVTETEKAWAKEKLSDKAFLKELDIFGNFIHGTHVAGIAIKGSKNKAMGIKLLPTEKRSALLEAKAEQPKARQTVDQWKQLENLFTSVSAQRMSALADISRFAASHQAEIINGSFGTGMEQAVGMADMAFNMIFKREATKEELRRAAILFMNTLVKAGQSFVGAAPNALFVFAAGNDGLSNDDYGTSPANIKADNVISVAATYEDQFFAPFSNYGVKTVDIAAPGMMIDSAIPGNEYLGVSGTSQASPYVANVAGQVKDANPRLRPIQIRRILMETVDKKSFLAHRVASGGMVNRERAVLAAELSTKVSLDEAIARAQIQIPAVVSQRKQFTLPKNILPISMPGLFE